MKRFATYQEFWPHYLEEHSLPLTKKLHVAGTILGVLWAVIAFFDKRPLHVPFGLVIGYLFAWAAHMFVEHNRPATFSHPIWSLISDFRMTYLVLTKKLSLR